jgi:hypothetical protein
LESPTASAPVPALHNTAAPTASILSPFLDDREAEMNKEEDSLVTAITGNTFTGNQINDLEQITMPGAPKKIHDGSLLIMLYHK